MSALKPSTETDVGVFRELRIAYVTETYPPEINGVSMTIGRTVAALQGRQHRVQLVRPRQDADPCGAPANGIEQVLVKGLPIPGYAGLRLGLPAKGLLLRHWTAQRPDIVHVATEGPLGRSALAAAEALGIPVVAGFHTNFHSYSRHYGIGWLRQPIHAYLRNFHNRANLTLVPTEALKDELTAASYRNVEVMARGVDTRLFTPERRHRDLRADWGVAENGLAVLYVGRIAPEKNLPLLVLAFEAIEAEHPNARLVLVGDGPALAGLKASHHRFIYCGPRRGEDLAAHYASANLFLFPSLTETFGNVLLEAMASGLASVSFDYAAAAEHVQQGANGLKAAVGDDDAFVAHAVALGRDGERRRMLGQGARATTLGLSWDHIFQGLEQHYRRLAGQGRPTTPAGAP
jgi:glycosyltransferase involved in cell wall biosynthesis